ncbi:hypothetical protein HDU93_007536 [Gonapodya sp. JEL0774]|nr:hypothetical protein HDU93_007536 [Gonapodya sp. JEL0774]
MLPPDPPITPALTALSSLLATVDAYLVHHAGLDLDLAPALPVDLEVGWDGGPRGSGSGGPGEQREDGTVTVDEAVVREAMGRVVGRVREAVEKTSSALPADPSRVLERDALLKRTHTASALLDVVRERLYRLRDEVESMEVST